MVSVKLRATLILCVFATIVGCNRTAIDTVGADADATAAMAWVAASAVQGSNPPAPDPDPDSDECENCSGTGKVGDGVIEKTCQVCNGTGKKRKAVAASNSSPPWILECYTHDRDREWIVKEAPLFESNQIDVVEMPAADGLKAPYFILRLGTRHWKFQELTWESFRLWRSTTNLKENP